MGLSSNPSNFPKDQKERKFTTYIFLEEQRNGEKVKRDWLVWSKAVASLFCFPCFLFGLPNLTRPGVQSSLLSWNGGIHGNWRKLSDRVKSHQQSDFHRNCYLQWKTATIHLKSQKSIEHQLEKQIGDKTKRWKVILQCILDVTIFLASRNLAFTGSNQKLFKSGNGNFLGALELIARHNKTLQDHMHVIAKHQEEEKRTQAHYLSWKSQNEFIKECGKLVVREVKERFLKLEELEMKKGSDITKLILNVLEENELDIKNYRGQGYDNGANMAGIYNGVQALIRQNNPQAIFILCSTHSLNLCAVHAIESSTPAKSYFRNIKKLYNLFSSSPVRWKILQEETGQSLHKLSVTDFQAKFKCLMAVNNVCLLLQSTQLTLDDEAKILNGLLMDLNRIRLSWDLILIEATEVAKNLKFDKIMFTVKRTRKNIISDETAGYKHE
nr:zinc finger MYM-type protein 1-like [Hydra vulgaris]